MKILTFDIEDWFHILDFDATKKVSSWKNFESRIHRNMDIIHEILEKNNLKATFFILSWIAEKYPEVVKKISDMGYEIGSHTYSHQLAYEQTRVEFYKDVDKSVKIIEDLIGEKVKCFRAPGFSITNKNLWAFEILKELGIEFDSSVFCTSRAHGGLKGFSIFEPSILRFNGEILKEFPISSHNILGKRIVFSGGGYFRLFPYYFIKKWSKKNEYLMTYFHPRDFDYEQPILEGLSSLRRFKCYVGLKKSRSKLEKLLDIHKFIDINEANKKINWNEVQVYNI